MEEVTPVRALSLRERAAIRLRHCRQSDPKQWKLDVTFESLMQANEWDLAQNYDELNERYSDECDQP